MHRRDFLISSLGASAVALSAKTWSAPATDQRFLVVFLRGGYDAINVVVPTYSDLYYGRRPTIAIPRPDPANANAALALDGQWSLHPVLKDSIYPLWQKKQITFVPFAGSDDTTRSHFETQETIELGQSVGGTRSYQSGFMARLASQISGASPISFTGQPPTTFRGADAVPNIAIGKVGKSGLDEQQAALIQQMYEGHQLQAAVREGFSVRDKAYAMLSGETAAANHNAAPPSNFELASRRIARLMKADYNLGFLDVGGWDTHVNQGSTGGLLAERVRQLGRGLSVLVEEMGPDVWAKTTVVVLSEFGRTFKENGDRGTDHGHGSVYWVLGGSLPGGRIAGEQVDLKVGNLNEGRDLPVLTDYRSMIGEITGRLYGLSQDRLSKVFPLAPAPSLNLI